MGRKKELLRRVTEQLNLPDEATNSLPLIEIAGDKRVLVENYSCIKRYCTTNVEILVDFGLFSVSGRSLEILRMRRDQLVIQGQIENIVLRRGERKCQD